MNFVNRHAVNLGLGLGQPGEDLPGSVFLPWSEPAGIDQRKNMVQITMLVLGCINHIDLCRPKTLPLDLTRNQTAIGQPQRANDRVKGLDIHARIDKRA